MPGLYSRYFIESDGNTILSDHWEGEFNAVRNAFEPQYMDDMSSDTTAMRAVTDPGESGTESLATSLDGEIKRIRKILAELSGKTHWYESPATSIQTLNANAGTFPGAATDNAVVRFDGTGGKTFQNSVVTINDAGSIAGITGCDATGANAIREATTRTTGTSVSQGGIAISNKVADHSITATSAGTDVTNATVTITVAGKPVFIQAVPFDGSDLSYVHVTGGSAGDQAYVLLIRDSTEIGRQTYTSNGSGNAYPGPFFIDTPSAGTYTYKLQAFKSGGITNIRLRNLKLVAVEK